MLLLSPRGPIHIDMAVGLFVDFITSTAHSASSTFEKNYRKWRELYLMDETLSWKEHVSSMGKKISSKLALFRRARKVLPKSACVTLYNTMVLPLFDYCAVVWDSCGQGSKSYLDKPPCCLYNRGPCYWV